MDRDGLICQNLRLVHSCCQRFKNRGIEYDDLYQAGCVGLVKAADAFDATRGFQFSTYAFPVIMGEIKRLFRDGGAVKVSRSLKELSLKITALSEKMSLKLGRQPQLSELAAELGITSEEAAEAVCVSIPPVSLSYTAEDGETKEMDIGVSKSAEEEVADHVAVEQLLKKLSDDERRLISLRYLGNKTQSETAKELGMTQVAVSRSEKRILKRLREYAG